MVQVGFEGLSRRRLYRDYLHRIDPRKVLEHYGAQNCSERYNFDDGSIEVIHSCLLDRVDSHHTNEDSHPSASMNIEKKLYTCYSLGYGCDIMHLIARLERKETITEALPIIGSFLEGTTTDADVFRAEVEKMLTARSPREVELPTYSERFLRPWLVAHPYWRSRGIDRHTCSRLWLGYDAEEKRAVFPHFFNHRLVGWQKRITPESDPQWPKYRSSMGFPKSETLYNYDVASGYRRVIVVESPMSVARAMTLGFPGTVATFGAKVSSRQLDLLKPFETVYVWFDDDKAGWAGERQVVEKLYRHVDVWVVPPDRGRDMGDSESGSELLRKIATAVPSAYRLSDYGKAGKWERRG